MESKLEEREMEIFKILKKFSKMKKIILVGGYAMNAYSDFPRFSIDCDLVVENPKSFKKILVNDKFKLKESDQYFERYEKSLNGLKIGIDLLIGRIFDRQSGINFDIEDLVKDSKLIIIYAKSDPKVSVKFNVASPEILFVTKLASLRKQDLRDIFMLAGYDLKREKVESLLEKYFKLSLKKERKEKVQMFLESKQFHNSLQGVYGRLPEKFFERNKKLLLSLLG